MRNQQKSSMKKYLFRIKRYLHIIYGSTKDEILKKIEADLASYAEDYEDFTYDDLVDVFGAPEEISAGYIRNQNATALYNALSVKKCVLTACLVTAFAAVITGGIKTYLNYRLYTDVKNSFIAYSDTTIVIYEPAEENNTYEEN